MSDTAYLNFCDIPSSTYEVVYADPPWFYYGSKYKDAAAGKHYNLMSDDDLASLPVLSKCSKKSVLFMWATGPRLNAALQLMQRWGFNYRGVAFVWVKTTMAGKVIHGQGVRPTVVKPTTEFVIVGSTAKTGRPIRLLDESIGQVVMAPRGKHSQKPEEVRRRIERLYGNVSKIELFARGSLIRGWDMFGDEISDGVVTP